MRTHALGGFAVHVSELAHTLAETGRTAHLLFVGDPHLPSQELLLDSRLVLHRWCQWISHYHPEGVYADEEGKWRDFSDSVPRFVVEELVRAALERGDNVVVQGEEWHTAEAMCRISDRLWQAGLRDRAVLLWNANDTIGFWRIDWQRLQLTSTITTVSRYMPDAIGKSFAEAGPADVLNITTTMPAESLRVLYRAADGVLANSGRQPFGLVGLETMAAGGTAFTGNTGEEYAQHMENAVVLDTADPSEAEWYVQYLAQHPGTRERLRAQARETARRFSWDRVLEQLLARVSVLAASGPGSPSIARS